MSTIKIDNGDIHIPLKSIEQNGVVVLNLAYNTYLIAPAESFANYPRELLRQIIEMVRQAHVAPTLDEIRYSPRKARALKELREKGYRVSGGEEYFPELPENPPSIEQVRQELSSYKGSLSDLVIAMRNEE